MVRFNIALLLLGKLSASAWAYTPFDPNQMICIGIGETRPADAKGKCPAGFHEKAISESEFLSKCFDNHGTWITNSQCGNQASAPKKYKYKDRKSQQDSYNKSLDTSKSNNSGASATADLEPVTEEKGKEGSIDKNDATAENGSLDASSITAGKNSRNERAQIKKDYKAHEKRVEDLRKELQESRDTRKQAKKDLRSQQDVKSDIEKEALTHDTDGEMTSRKGKVDDAIGKQDAKVTTAKEAVETKKTELRQARKDERKARKANDAAEGVDDIKEKHDGTYGGNYGGEDVATSQAISQTSTQVSTATDAVSGQKVQMAAQDREAALRQQGVANTSMEQINQARRETADDAKKSLNTGGILDMALGAFQAFRAEEHFRSMSDVSETASRAKLELGSQLTDNKADIETKANLKIGELDGKISAAQIANDSSQLIKLEDERNKALAKKEADLKAAEDDYNARMSNVSKNKREENKSQTNAGVAQGVAAGGMIMQGVQKLQQAAAINAIEAQMAGNAQQYGFAMGGGITQGGGQDGVNSLSPVQSAVTTEEEGKKEDLAQNSNINPNDPNLVPEGPPAGAFIESKDQGGGGGGGAGPGMAGGTSADKSAMEAGAQGPAAVTKAGSYAPVAGGAGYKSRNAGGAGKAGVDTGFADLLKKFLPGAEPEKKKGPGELQFGDRSPASNQTAVIGRNKNIFEEISKRYQKKSAEGSVF